MPGTKPPLTWEAALALRHAPVLLQKVHSRYSRADYITRVDFAGGWDGVCRNWDAVWDKRGGGYRYNPAAHGYYSVVETHTHYYLLYAFYHPQDWSAFWGSPARSDPSEANQHVHDMEGCLAVVPKRGGGEGETVEALVTVSHRHFLSYAGREPDGRTPTGSLRVTGWEEDVDGPIEVTSRFSGRGEPAGRLKLYADSGGHAIRATKRGWGSESNIIRYRPTLGRAESPKESAFEKETDAKFQTVRYQLVSIFERDGLWAQRENPSVFRPDEAGRQAFVEMSDEGGLTAGAANPPWGWDDADDGYKFGDFAWDPARLADGYFAGMGEFSRQYLHNPYIGLIRG